MSALQVTARLTIHDGNLAEFKELAARCMQSVRDNDSGTLQYDWFFNHDETVCVVREAYRDSEAALEHVSNLGETLGELLQLCDLDLEIYGAPTTELVAATSEMAPKMYAPFQSI